MGNLSAYLQREFNARRPAGWRCAHEVPLLSPELAQLLDYAPRVDVLLEREDGAGGCGSSLRLAGRIP